MKKSFFRILPAVILFVSAIVVLGGCEKSKYPITVDWSLIGKGAMYGNGAENLEPQNIVIKNAAEWQNLISSMDSHSNTSNSFVEKKIDFDNFIIIAVIDSVRPNSGYTISIDKVQEQKKNIQIGIVYQQGNTGYNVMNQPFYIIKIPKYNKEIIFSPKKYVCV